jgi:predicted PurR-regulated permease PerM
MAQQVTNLGDHRSPEQPAQPNLPPPEVAVARPAVARPHPRRNDWAFYAVGLGAIAAICYFAEEILVVILVSVLLSFVLAPIADLLSRLRMPRWLAAAIAVTLLVVALCGVAYYGVNQMFNLVDELPKYSGRVRVEVAKIARRAQTLEAMNPTPEKGAVKVRETQSWTDLLSHGFGSATEIVLACSFIPFLIFFMLTWQQHARAATVGLFPLENRREAYSTMGQIATMVRSFILGNLLIAVAVGGVSTVVFALLKIPFFYFVGFASGFLSLIPYLGVILALFPPLFVGISHLTLETVVGIALTVFVLHILAINVLYPQFLGSRLRLNPLAVTLALLVWAWLWGAVGLILAVPITAGMKIVFDHVQPLKPFGAWMGEDSQQNGGSGNQ